MLHSLLDVDSTNLDDYNIHVIASVFKQWLRDLPNPLLTFELYEEFIRAMGKWLFYRRASFLGPLKRTGGCGLSRRPAGQKGNDQRRVFSD